MNWETKSKSLKISTLLFVTAQWLMRRPSLRAAHSDIHLPSTSKELALRPQIAAMKTLKAAHATYRLWILKSDQVQAQGNTTRTKSTQQSSRAPTTSPSVIVQRTKRTSHQLWTITTTTGVTPLSSQITRTTNLVQEVQQLSPCSRRNISTPPATRNARSNNSSKNKSQAWSMPKLPFSTWFLTLGTNSTAQTMISSVSMTHSSKKWSYLGHHRKTRNDHSTLI